MAEAARRLRSAVSASQSARTDEESDYALRDLLAALDASRGEAVAWRVWRGDSYELFFSEDAARRRCQCFVQQRSPEPLYAAPPAAVFKSTAKRVAALQARDAAQAPPAAAVPEGYALVPVEPTRGMRKAGLERLSPDDCAADFLDKAWPAMLAAANKENTNG